MLDAELVRKITAMAQPARPTEGQVEELLGGWSDYFGRMEIPLGQQTEEFDGIMRARVHSGIITLVAPGGITA
jgi:hypothetical protein